MDKKVFVISNRENKGIAYAQNQALKYLKEKGCEWALMFDQDSVANKTLEKAIEWLERENNSEKNAIVGLNYYDSRIDVYASLSSSPLDVEEVISSGSFVNIKICSILGGMKEHFFIDQVDNEYCYRVKKNGYSIVLLPFVCFDHQMGNIKKHSFFGSTFYTYNQKPIRTYYRARNLVLLSNEYPELLKRNKVSLRKDFFKIMFENQKMKKYYYYFKGIKDAKKMIKCVFKNEITI